MRFKDEGHVDYSCEVCGSEENVWVVGGDSCLCRACLDRLKEEAGQLLFGHIEQQRVNVRAKRFGFRRAKRRVISALGEIHVSNRH